MTIEEIINLIGTQGFAIAVAICCLYFSFKLVMWFLKEGHAKDEANAKAISSFTDALNKNTTTIEKVEALIQVLVNQKKPGE